MDEFLQTKLGRAFVAMGFTALIVLAFRRRRTWGRFPISMDESPKSFGCMILIWMTIAAGFGISVFF